ncbi:3-oxo-5-alpha-steroid 4-dehydrogenase 1 isoform X2 [Polyodon spathula]|uniref:3-oxo-5-alpha-steroid 4-dehydrogenase 1 isoform X2 n=1 Tax=Polyodon spathula TaxID=7913 RepID=UPI001B7EEBF0|nr:3-oxo-5-alpha-steroid 4-dehydrogenase 1 isoform X2 [Polyodon spathula]
MWNSLFYLLSSEAGEPYQLEWMAYVMVLMGLLSFLFSLFVNVPYGRYASSKFGFPVSVKLAWFLQELPSLLVPIHVVVFTAADRSSYLTNQVLIGMFLCHYIQRTLVYPFLIRGGKPTPFISFAMAFMFCVYNGYMQGKYLSHFAVYPSDWIRHPCFITGGMFEYISGANFFGEIIEWTGFAIATWSLQGAAFAIFTFLVLSSRATQHHRWYIEKFEDYPKSRKAFIPFLY